MAGAWVALRQGRPFDRSRPPGRSNVFGIGPATTVTPSHRKRHSLCLRSGHDPRRQVPPPQRSVLRAMGEHPAQPHSTPGTGVRRRRRSIADVGSPASTARSRTGSLHRPARWFPQLGSLTHVGRRTHEVYRTPVSVFRTRDGFRIPLTHGRGADWVQNALNHGAVRLTTRRTIYELTDPVIVHDTERKYLPWPWRTFLRFFGVSYFIDFRAATAARDV